MRRMLSSLFIVLACVGTGIVPAAAQSLESLLQAADDYRAPGRDFTTTVNVSAPGSAPLTLKVFVNDRTKSLVQYVEPAKSQGRALLFVDTNMWVYVPGTRRALRISPNQQILGGVSSADIARTVLSIDYQATAVANVSKAANVRGGPFQELTLAPRGRGAAYGRVDLLIDSAKRPQRAIFYSKSNRKLKTAYFSNYKNAAGQLMPLTITIIDHMEGDEKTTIRYSDVQREQTPSAWFQPNFLPRL